MKLRSKRHFRTATAEKTWADIEKPQSLATRTRSVIMNITKPQGKSCLSLGCGWGRFLKSYLEKGGRQVVGADINRSNLLICKRVGADLVLCDIENLPFKSDVFDVMECMATMEHIDEPTVVMKEMRRVSTNLGNVFISWPYFNWIRAFHDPALRNRLILAIRDFIPSRIGLVLAQKRFIGFKEYGLFRNKGVSLQEIYQIYADASMPVSDVAGCPIEGIFLVYSRVTK
jgi:2-polyprenyl-3-methyl-5-hydroxy-6-metoxy-1,4-benzoquinol methylase